LRGIASIRIVLICGKVKGFTAKIAKVICKVCEEIPYNFDFCLGDVEVQRVDFLCTGVAHEERSVVGRQAHPG
jgi:hypothetical protein